MICKKDSKKIVIACISDIHFHDNEAWRILDELRSEFLAKIRELGDSLDAVMILGDLFHARVSMNGPAAAAVLLFINELLDIMNGRPVRIVRGTISHDHNMLESLRFTEERNVAIINEVSEEELEIKDTVNDDIYALKFLYLPEEYPQDWREYYADVLPPKEPYDIIFGHGMVDFAAHSSVLLESERQIKSAVVFPTSLLVKSANVSIFGHVHAPTNNKSVYYCGSFSRFAFGEEAAKGWIQLTLDVDDNSYRIKRIENTKAPEYNSFPLADIIKKEKDIEVIIDRISDLLNSSHVRIQVPPNVTNEVISQVSVIREHFADNPNFTLQRKLGKSKDTLAEGEEDASSLELIKNKDLPVDETIHRHLTSTEEKACITLEEIREIISPEED